MRSFSPIPGGCERPGLSGQASPFSRWRAEVLLSGDIAVLTIAHRPTMSNTAITPYVDKCAQCETYVLTDSAADLIRRMNAHELARHGRTRPTRPDHGASDFH